MHALGEANGELMAEKRCGGCEITDRWLGAELVEMSVVGRGRRESSTLGWNKRKIQCGQENSTYLSEKEVMC